MLNLLTDLYLMILTAGEEDSADGEDDAGGEDDSAKGNGTDDAGGSDDDSDDAGDVDLVPLSDLKEVRSEAAKYRRQLRALEAKVDESAKTKEKADAQADIDKLEGLEKEQALTAEANKQLAEATATIATKEAQIKAQAIGAAVYSAANAAGFESPEDAGALLDLGGIEVTDGEVDAEEINELVKELAESKSYLLKGEVEEMGNTGPTNPPNKKGIPNASFTSKDDILRLKKLANEGMAKGNMNSAITLYNQAWEKERGVKPS